MADKKGSILKKVILVLVGLFVLIQLVPYGRGHTNPPVVQEPNWDSPQTRQLAQQACFDCHSNETEWPWYSNIAPVSWLVQRDVDEGREHLNFSNWPKGRKADDPEEIVEEIEEGEMPLWFYVILHPEAKLDEVEKKQLMTGLRATALASMPPGKGRVETLEEENEKQEEHKH